MKSVIRSGWRTWATGLAIGVAVIYGVVLAGAVLLERRLLYFPDTAPAPPPTPAIQAVTIATEDGERLAAWWLPPQPGRPVILFFDGNGGRLGAQANRFARVAEAGIGQLSIAYRGYSGSTGTPSEAGLHKDARAAYAWAAKRYPPESIVLHGFSLGSGVAVRLAAERPVRALVLEAPYTATVDVAAERFPYLPVHLLMRDRFESRRYIDQVRVPLLIAHGDRDRVVPFHSGERLFALANEPKRFVRFRGEDHVTLVRAGLYPEIWRFLEVD